MERAFDRTSQIHKRISQRGNESVLQPFHQPFGARATAIPSSSPNGGTRPSTFLSGKGFPVQADLKIGAPNDKYEQEADAMAERVVNGSVQAFVAPLPAMQRQPAGQEGEKGSVFRDNVREWDIVAGMGTHARGQRYKNAHPGLKSGTLKEVIQRIGEEHGQSVSGSTRHMICDLTSPIRVGSEPRYELIQHGAELWSQDSERTYLWKVFNDRGTEVFRDQTDSPTIRMAANVSGNFVVQVMVLSNGAATGIRLDMRQRVIAEDSGLTLALSGMAAGSAQTYRELVNDFRTYIIDAANSTGPNGITPRFLASVLFVEILNRPKAGREDELEGVAGNIATLQRGETLYPWNKVNRSVGVGQLRLSTVAMNRGDTPWIEQDRTDRSAARDQIDSNFDALGADDKAAILDVLRWPKSNIQEAANLLARLKNRPHRFPAMTREAFDASEHAVGVVATEYNSGGTNTPENRAGASGYGGWVWDNMSNPIIQSYFP